MSIRVTRWRNNSWEVIRNTFFLFLLSFFQQCCKWSFGFLLENIPNSCSLLLLDFHAIFKSRYLCLGKHSMAQIGMRIIMEIVFLQRIKLSFLSLLSSLMIKNPLWVLILDSCYKGFRKMLIFMVCVLIFQFIYIMNQQWATVAKH